MYLSRGSKVLFAGLWVCILLIALTGSVAAQAPTRICFWSAQGPVCVERPVEMGDAGLDPEGSLAALWAGPTVEERARGLWSAIPQGTMLEGLEVQPDGTVIVFLGVPPDSLRSLDHDTFEAVVDQIGWTLDLALSVHGGASWRDLRIQTWAPSAEKFVPLAAFLPEIPAPRKEAVLDKEVSASSVTYVGQPPAPGQGQPQGTLSGKTVYVRGRARWTGQPERLCAGGLDPGRGAG